MCLFSIITFFCIQRLLVSVFITKHDFHPFLAALQRFGYANHGTYVKRKAPFVSIPMVAIAKLTHMLLKDLADFPSVDCGGQERKRERDLRCEVCSIVTYSHC